MHHWRWRRNLACKICFQEILSISRVRKGQVDDEDLYEVFKNADILLQKNYKNEQVRKMYTRYQNLWMMFVAKKNVKKWIQIHETSQIILRVKAHTLTKHHMGGIFLHQFNLHWRIRLRPWRSTPFKNYMNKYVAKKSDTFRPEEIHQVLKIPQDEPTTKATLSFVAIALLYIGLLSNSEVKNL